MATDFFDQQDAARRRTGLLVVLVVLAMLAIILAVYFAVTAIYLLSGSARDVRLFAPHRLAVVATIVVLVIGMGTLFKILALREGGAAVARLLGGRLVDPGTTEPAERRLLNVVEEMALASGTPVPSVYLLDKESGINAFAAGFTPGDAVVTASRGCLDHLTRDELQGVVAHEFSHLLNGDMRLNLRLMGLLYGILLIAVTGQGLMRVTGQSTSDSKRNPGIVFFLLGLALFVIGWAGVFFSRLIKCAISRQREFLADASAVQFTRNPQGIAGALKKIGGLAQGSRIESPHAEEACHMFLSAGVPSFAALLATHPPLVERIRRLEPSFDGRFDPIGAQTSSPAEIGPDPPRVPAESARALVAAADPVESALVLAHAGAPERAHVDFAARLVAAIPGPLLDAVRTASGARTVVYALLLDADPDVRGGQMTQLRSGAEPGTAAEVDRLEPLIAPLGAAFRLPLVELALPALRQLTDHQYRQFHDLVDFLVASDRKLSLFEFALQRMLRRHLDPRFRRHSRPTGRYVALGRLADHLAVLFSALAYVGHPERAGAAQAFADAMARFGVARGGAALLPRETCSLAGLDIVLNRLAAASPQVRGRVLDACTTCIASDGRVTIAEGELLRAIADSLDCPVPPLLSGSLAGDGSPGRA